MSGYNRGRHRETAPAEGGSSPEARPTESRGTVDTTTIRERLAKLEEKYLHELLPEEERLELRDRILKLKAKTEKAGRA